MPTSPSRPQDSLVSLRGVTKRYDTPAGGVDALSDVSLEIARGELVAIVGRSGSGKTTLAHLITGIDRASRGETIVRGTALASLSESELARFRGREVGVVFQFFQLIPTLTILENVMLPMELASRPSARAQRERAVRLLARVGIEEQGAKLPHALSGGQQQRAAIARALANDPALLVADEPTGNLDSATSAAVWRMFAELNEEGKTVVVVTHDRETARLVPRVVELADGRVASDGDARRASQPEAARA
jgi:putative ABC transport system ATP-binding protein